MGDRRGRARFEVTGDLGGTLGALVVLRVRDAGRGGVLTESPMPLTVGAQHSISVRGDGTQVFAQVAVRHVRRASTSDGEPRYLIGLEFVTLTPALLEVLDRWAALEGEASA